MDRKTDVCSKPPLIASAQHEGQFPNVSIIPPLQLDSHSSRGTWNITIKKDGISSFEFTKVQTRSSVVAKQGITNVKNVPNVSKGKVQRADVIQDQLQFAARPKTVPAPLSVSATSRTKVSSHGSLRKNKSERDKDDRSCGQIARSNFSEILETQIKLVDYKNSDIPSANSGNTNYASCGSLPTTASPAANEFPVVSGSVSGNQTNQTQFPPKLMYSVNQDRIKMDSLKHDTSLISKANSPSEHSLSGCALKRGYNLKFTEDRNSKGQIIYRKEPKNCSVSGLGLKENVSHDLTSDKGSSKKPSTLLHTSKGNSPRIMTAHRRNYVTHTFATHVSRDASFSSVPRSNDNREGSPTKHDSRKSNSKKSGRTSSKSRSNNARSHGRHLKNQTADPTLEKCDISQYSSANNLSKGHCDASHSSSKPPSRKKSHSGSRQRFTQQHKQSRTMTDKIVVVPQNHKDQNNQNRKKARGANKTEKKVSNRSSREVTTSDTPHPSSYQRNRSRSTSNRSLKDGGLNVRSAASSSRSPSNIPTPLTITLTLRQPPTSEGSSIDGACKSGTEPGAISNIPISKSANFIINRPTKVGTSLYRTVASSTSAGNPSTSETFAHQPLWSANEFPQLQNISNILLKDNTSKYKQLASHSSSEITEEQLNTDKTHTSELKYTSKPPHKDDSVKNIPILINADSQPVSKYPISPGLNRQNKERPISNRSKDEVFKLGRSANRDSDFKSKENIATDLTDIRKERASSNRSLKDKTLKTHHAVTKLSTDLTCKDKSRSDIVEPSKGHSTTNRPSRNRRRKRKRIAKHTAKDTQSKHSTTEQNNISNRIPRNVNHRRVVSHTSTEIPSKDIHVPVANQSVIHHSSSYISIRDRGTSKTRSTTSHSSAVPTSKGQVSIDTTHSSKRPSNRSNKCDFRRDRPSKIPSVSHQLSIHQSTGDNAIKDHLQAIESVELISRAKSKAKSDNALRAAKEHKTFTRSQSSVVANAESNVKSHAASGTSISKRSVSSQRSLKRNTSIDRSKKRRPPREDKTKVTLAVDVKQKRNLSKERATEQKVKDSSNKEQNFKDMPASSSTSKEVTVKYSRGRRRSRERTVSQKSGAANHSADRTEKDSTIRSHKRPTVDSSSGKVDSKSSSAAGNKEIVTIHRPKKSRPRHICKKEPSTMHDDFEASSNYNSSGDDYSTDSSTSSEMSTCPIASLIQNRPPKHPPAKTRMRTAVESQMYFPPRPHSGALLYRASSSNLAPSKGYNMGVSYPIDRQAAKPSLRSIGSAIAKESVRGKRISHLDHLGSFPECVDPDNFYQRPRASSIVGHDVIAPPAPRSTIPSVARAKCLLHGVNLGPAKFDLRLRSPPPCICRHYNKSRGKKIVRSANSRLKRKSEKYGLRFQFRPIVQHAPKMRITDHLRKFLHDLGKSIVPPERYRGNVTRNDANGNKPFLFPISVRLTDSTTMCAPPGHFV